MGKPTDKVELVNNWFRDPAYTIDPIDEDGCIVIHCNGFETWLFPEPEEDGTYIWLVQPEDGSIEDFRAGNVGDFEGSIVAAQHARFYYMWEEVQGS